LDVNEFVKQVLINILNVLIIPLLPVVTALIMAYIRKKTAELENSTKKLLLLKYYDIFENAISSSVSVVNQIYIDEIIKSNGFLSDAEKSKAFELIKNNVLKIVGDTGVNILNQLYKDSEAYLNNRIEYYNYCSNALKNGVMK